MIASDVIAALPSMSPEDRAKIVAACRVLGVVSPVDAGRGLSPGEMFWSGLSRVLADQGSSLAAVGIIKKHKLWPKFAEEAALLDTWITANFAPEDPIERLKCYRVVAMCVVRMYRKWKLDCVNPVLLRCTKDAQEAVLAAFPGYAEAGALRRFVLLHTGSRGGSD